MRDGSTRTNMFRSEEPPQPLTVINANVKRSACNFILIQQSYFACCKKTLSLIRYAQPHHVSLVPSFTMEGGGGVETSLVNTSIPVFAWFYSVEDEASWTTRPEEQQKKERKKKQERRQNKANTCSVDPQWHKEGKESLKVPLSQASKRQHWPSLQL